MLEPDAHELPITFIIAGSHSFRQKLIKLHTDSLFCSLMNTNLGRLAPENIWRALVKGGRELEFGRQGQIVYRSRNAKTSRPWFVVVSGKLRVSVDTDFGEKDNDVANEHGKEEAPSELYEISTGDVFGGYWIAGNRPPVEVSHVLVEAMEASRVLELSGELLATLLKEDAETANLLLSRMGGNGPLMHFLPALPLSCFRQSRRCSISARIDCIRTFRVGRTRLGADR